MQQVSLHFFLFGLIALSLCISITNGNPISPEIGKDSGKNTQIHDKNHFNNHNNFQTNSQDALINSLNTYVSSFDSISSADNNKPPFTPSYKLPPMETNFVPLQSSSSISSHPPSTVSLTSDLSTASATSLNSGTPLLMQYMPQMMREGGIQYLQLIPTHPLIVPISPYLSAGSNPTAVAYNNPEIQASNSLADYTGQSAAIYPNHAINTQSSASTKLVDTQSGNIPPGMQAYANNLQHYRNIFRINREVKEKQLPSGMSLNINEYIPVNPESLNGLYIRGRP